MQFKVHCTNPFPLQCFGNDFESSGTVEQDGVIALLAVIENMLFQSKNSLDSSLPLSGELPSKEQVDILQQKMAFNEELLKRLEWLSTKV